LEELPRLQELNSCMVPPVCPLSHIKGLKHIWSQVVKQFYLKLPVLYQIWKCMSISRNIY